MSDGLTFACAVCIREGRGMVTPVAVAGAFVDGTRWTNYVCSECGATVSTFIDMGKLDLDAVRGSVVQGPSDFEVFGL